MTTPNIFSSARENKTAVLATTNFRNNQVPFGIKESDRRAHLYLIGKTGTGKSTLLETLMRHDIKTGNGFALLDPHGDLVNKIRSLIPSDRQSDFIDFDVSDERQPYGFNPLAGIHPERRSLAASGMLSVFKHLWSDSWGPRLEHLLRNSLLTLLEQQNATLADILRLFDDKEYRRRCASRLSNSQVKKFWLSEYEKYPERLRAEAIAPVQNKVGAFVTNPLLNRILTRAEKPLNLRKVIDSGKILLVSLAKGKIGEDTALLLGSLLISRMESLLSRTLISTRDNHSDYFLDCIKELNLDKDLCAKSVPTQPKLLNSIKLKQSRMSRKFNKYALIITLINLAKQRTKHYESKGRTFESCRVHLYYQ